MDAISKPALALINVPPMSGKTALVVTVADLNLPVSEFVITKVPDTPILPSPPKERWRGGNPKYRR